MPRQATNEERSESRWLHVPNPFQTTNQGRSEILPIHTSSFILGGNEMTNESERIQIPRPTQVANTERSESRQIHMPRPIQSTNQGRIESLPIHTSTFILGGNEIRNESERARFLNQRLDQLGQRRPHARQHAFEENQKSCCDVCKALISCMESIWVCCTERSDERKSSDIVALQVLFLISLQLLVMAILTMVCLQNDAKADSVVHSHKWVLGLSFLMCFSVLIAHTFCKDCFQLVPVNIIMFLIWSTGVVLTLSWITVLLSFDFLSLLIFFLWLWIASILVSGIVFAQPLVSFCSVPVPLCVIGTSIALFITVGSKSMVSVSFASFVSLLVLLYLLLKLHYFIDKSSDWLESYDAFYIGTCILF